MRETQVSGCVGLVGGLSRPPRHGINFRALLSGTDPSLPAVAQDDRLEGSVEPRTITCVQITQPEVPGTSKVPGT